jgi:hypothetical protein
VYPTGLVPLSPEILKKFWTSFAAI